MNKEEFWKNKCEIFIKHWFNRETPSYRNSTELILQLRKEASNLQPIKTDICSFCGKPETLNGGMTELCTCPVYSKEQQQKVFEATKVAYTKEKKHKNREIVDKIRQLSTKWAEETTNNYDYAPRRIGFERGMNEADAVGFLEWIYNRANNELLERKPVNDFTNWKYFGKLKIEELYLIYINQKSNE